MGKAGGGFFEVNKGQTGGGGLGVDQAVEEAGFGSGQTLGRERREQPGMQDEAGHGEEALEAGEKPHDHRGIQRRADFRAAHSIGR